MSYFTLLFLVPLTQSQSSQTCDVYDCQTLSNACMITIGNFITIDITKCNSTSTCISDSMGFSSCQLDSYIYNLLPGRTCSEDWYCQSGVCTNGKCIGLSLNGSCSDTSQCNPGLFCNYTTSRCETTKQLGKLCSTSESCSPILGCNNGTCIEFFSLPDGAILSSGNCDNSTDGFFQILCQSGMCYVNANGTGVCGEALTYSGGDFVQCSNSSDCGITYGNITNYMTCKCTWSAAADQYCQLTTGSSAGQAYIKFVKSIYNMPAVLNFNYWEDYYEIAKDSGNISLYEEGVYTEYSFYLGRRFHGAPNCVIQNYIASDYSAYSNYSFGKIVGIGILLGLAGL